MQKIILLLCFFLYSIMQASNDYNYCDQNNLQELRFVKRTLQQQLQAVQARQVYIGNQMYQMEQAKLCADDYWNFILTYNQYYFLAPEATRLNQQHGKLRSNIRCINNLLYKKPVDNFAHIKEASELKDADCSLPPLKLNIPCNNSADFSGISTPVSTYNSGMTTKTHDDSTITSHSSIFSSIQQDNKINISANQQAFQEKKESELYKRKTQSQLDKLRHQAMQKKLQLDGEERERRAKQSADDKLAEGLHKQKQQEHKNRAKELRLQACNVQSQKDKLKKQELQKTVEQNRRKQESNAIVDSLYIRQMTMLEELADGTQKDKKAINLLHQSVNKWVRENDLSTDSSKNTPIVEQLAAITQQSLKDYAGIENQNLANWIAVKAFKNANFDTAKEHCGRTFDADKICDIIVQPTLNQEYAQTLSKDLQENKVPVAEQQINKIIYVEQNVLLGCFALAYKKAK